MPEHTALTTSLSPPRRMEGLFVFTPLRSFLDSLHQRSWPRLVFLIRRLIKPYRLASTWLVGDCALIFVNLRGGGSVQLQEGGVLLQNSMFLLFFLFYFEFVFIPWQWRVTHDSLFSCFTPFSLTHFALSHLHIPIVCTRWINRAPTIFTVDPFHFSSIHRPLFSSLWWRVLCLRPV